MVNVILEYLDVINRIDSCLIVCFWEDGVSISVYVVF